MVSQSMEQKLARMRAAAPLELPKTRLCARVVLASLPIEARPEGGDDLQPALQALKAGLGPRWSAVTSFQFMSGRQAEFAAECGLPEERVSLLWAHLLAKKAIDVASANGQAGLTRALIEALQAQARARFSEEGR